MPVATYTHSRDRPDNYVAAWRRPPHTTRRTATTVLAGNYGWLEFDDLLALRTNKPTPDPSGSTSAAASDSALPSQSQPVLRDTNDDMTASAPQPPAGPTGRRGTVTATSAPSTAPAKGGRGKTKTKPPPVARPVDMGVSIIPICAPGTGTPSPSPEPPSPPPHPHPRRPPQSSASTSSGVSSSIAGGGRLDFDAGAQRAAGTNRAAGATVGKRSRGPSQSQHQYPPLPISPPVTSPNTSNSELPPFPGANGVTRPPTSAPPPTNGTKRAREGREAQRRKRRKTETRGEVPPVAVKDPQVEHVGDAVRKQAPSRAPARRKGWKGWVMVSDTEGSDAERAATPPVVILEKKTRSGRDFDQDILPRVNRRGRSTVSVGTESVTTSAAPLSSVTAT
ncbi:hypothetical protein FRC07_012326 [Ceratobasidium sp. 392]|nr:hypothetical protein FRC07_012326 [Ceratobasidium sp. 392]